MSKVIDGMAKHQHEIWAHWMKYQFSVCELRDGGLLIPFDRVERWTRQMNTEYENLSEEEKQSDRDIVKQFLWIELGTIQSVSGE